MHCHHVAIVEHILERVLLAQELGVVLDHRLFKRWKSCRKEGKGLWCLPCMPMPLIRLFESAYHYRLQESCGGLFASLDVAIRNNDLLYR